MPSLHLCPSASPIGLVCADCCVASSICRKRHMKCDEVKPQCGPCAKGDRPCVYGPLPPELNTPKASNSGSRQQFHAASAEASSPVQERLPRESIATETGAQTAPIENAEICIGRQWPSTPGDEATQITSPQSNYSNSTGYGTEVAPLRWFGLLAGDAASGSLDIPSLEVLSDAALARRHETYPDGVANPELARPMSRPYFGSESFAAQNPSKLLQISAFSPTTNGANGAEDERQHWQAAEPIQLKDHEFDIFQRFVTGISLWIDLFDPLAHFSTLVPHLALHNEGLMKALLALGDYISSPARVKITFWSSRNGADHADGCTGARHLSIKPLCTGDANVDRTAAVQYYYETLRYLQTAMRYTTYKNSLELLATALIVSTYEMIDGAGNGWERHLKGVFWIQRSREINGESGGLEQAIWWAWLRQDVWAAFRENRRCFSFFKPTKVCIPPGCQREVVC